LFVGATHTLRGCESSDGAKLITDNSGNQLTVAAIDPDLAQALE